MVKGRNNECVPKKFMGIMILAPVFFIVFLLFSKPALAATQDNADKSQAMAEALAQAESAPSSASPSYKQRLGQVIVKEEEAQKQVPQEIDTFIRFLPKEGARAIEGGVGIVHSAFEYSYNFKAFGKLPIQFGIGSEYIGIENSTEVKLPAHLTDIAFGLEATLPLFNFKNAYFRFRAAPSFPADNWRVGSSAFRIPQRYFVIYQPNTQLTLIAGIGVYPSNEDVIGPIAGLIYKHNDKLLFNIVPPRPQIVYSINDKLDVFAEGGIIDSEFQVEKDGYKRAILAYKEMRLGTGVKYSVNKFIDASVSAGGTFNRTFKYRDSLGKVNIKNGLYTEFRVEAQF